MCEPGKYTLSMFEQSCSECPIGGNCTFGNLYPLSGLIYLIFIYHTIIGFWRSNDNSSVLIKCLPFQDSCLFDNLFLFYFKIFLLFLKKRWKRKQLYNRLWRPFMSNLY